MRLIGLTGKAGCGKDTVGEMLSMPPEGDGMPFEPLAFATPLKDMLDVLLEHLGDDTHFAEFGWDDREWKERPLASIDKSPRRLAQTLGTEWGREMIHPDIWLKCAAHSVALLYEEGVEHIVFTDCRFENEAAWIRDRGGEVWHILRDTAPIEAHDSERGVAFVPGIDSVIDNSGDLDSLSDQVARALRGELKVEQPKEAA